MTHTANEFATRIQKAISPEHQNFQLGRYVTTLEILRTIAQANMKVVDIASFGTLKPALRDVLGLNDVTITGLPFEGADTSLVTDRFDIEEPFPYPDETFDIAILTEVVEHITRDPMHTMSEINRITKEGGWLLLSTPNSCSLRSVRRTLLGNHPFHWSPYSAQGNRDRHNREYTVFEIRELLEAAGYEIVKLLTQHDAYDPPPRFLRRYQRWIANRALAFASLVVGNYISPSMRGEITLALARKTGKVKKRFPEFLYY